MVLNSFHQIARVEWDTLLFFFGIIFAVGGLGVLGYLALASEYLYGDIGPTFANIAIGILSAIVDNIPLMFAVLTMDPHVAWPMAVGHPHSRRRRQSAFDRLGRRCRPHGPCPRAYTFSSHLKWTWAIALGYAASIIAHLLIKGAVLNERPESARFALSSMKPPAASSSSSPPLWRSFATNDGVPSLRSLLDLPVSVSIGTSALKKPLLLWINDGLMAVFFFLVALEIKREMLDGHLSSRDQMILPAIAAVGGMAGAISHLCLFQRGLRRLARLGDSRGDRHRLRAGRPGPLGIARPLTLKIFLLTLATLDDLVAIVVIALFYTDRFR